MYQIILILALFILNTETAKPLESKASLLDSKNSNDGLGNYFYSFHTSNGIVREETGRLVNGGSPDEYISVEGFYSYSDEDGNIKTVLYKAGKDGYVIKPPLSQEQYGGVPEVVVASLLG